MRLLAELERIDERCIVAEGDDTKIPGILLIVGILLLWRGVQHGWSSPASRVAPKKEASVVWHSTCSVLPVLIYHTAQITALSTDVM